MTNAELAILSLVVEQPRHGYEIEQVIVDREMRQWTDLGFSSIYYVLRKLEAAGLVIGRREPAPGRGPSRRVYSVTPDGRKAWRRHVLAALARPARGSSGFQLGLANLPRLEPGAVAAALQKHAGDLESRLEHICGRRSGALPFHVEAMLDLAATQVEAELSWVRRFARQLERRRAAAHPAAGREHS